MRTWQSDEMAVKSYVSSKPVEELGNVSTVKQEFEYCETAFLINCFHIYMTNFTKHFFLLMTAFILNYQ